MKMMPVADIRQDYAFSALSGVREGRFDVSFCRQGTRTRIRDRYISYPFHMTRPFMLDVDIPQLLTLYQQSSSGGLYQDDRLTSSFILEEEAAAYVTSQASTIVHHCYDRPCQQTSHIKAQGGSFFISVPDSVILFPGAWLENKVIVTMSREAHLLLHESFTWHNPHQNRHKNDEPEQAIFNRIASQLQVEDEAGRVVVRDAFRLEGEDMLRPSSPMSDWALCSTCLLLGQPDRLPRRERLEEELQLDGQIAGLSTLPNEAGFFVRSLSRSANVTKTLVERMSNLMAGAYFGVPLALRRK